MQFGIHLPQVGRKAGPESIQAAAREAEALGYDNVWVNDHLAVPADADYPPSPYFYEPVVTLTWAAAATNRIGLGTSVLILPLRHPVHLAKELATLDLLSQGRLIVGAGVGWLEGEFEALGVPFAERGARTDETIRMLRACWGEDPVSYRGEVIAATLTEVPTQPQPGRRIPIWIGGNSGAALRRAVALGDGWHGIRKTPTELEPIVERLRRDRPRLHGLAPVELGRPRRRCGRAHPPARRLRRNRPRPHVVRAPPAHHRVLARLHGGALASAGALSLIGRRVDVRMSCHTAATASIFAVVESCPTPVVPGRVQRPHRAHRNSTTPDKRRR